jgi:hypothetical protein
MPHSRAHAQASSNSALKDYLIADLKWNTNQIDRVVELKQQDGDCGAEPLLTDPM